MKKDITAIIDIGSNSVRLALFTDGKIFFKTSITTQLAKDKKDGVLNDQSMERTFKGIDNLYFMALKENASEILAFATAAVRNAKNKDSFIATFKEKYGFPLDVLSGEREAEAGITGAIGSGDGTVIDVGGGSTEIITRKNGKIVFSQSMQEGAVSITDKFKKDFKKATEFLMEKTSQFDGAIIENKIVAIGGTANTIAFAKSKLSIYDSEKLDKTHLNIGELADLVSDFYVKSPEEIQENYHIEKLRSEVIHSGSNILLTILKKFEIENILLRESDNLEGYYALKRGGMSK